MILLGIAYVHRPGADGPMTAKSRGFLRDNSLSLVFGGLFLVTLVGQAISGRRGLQRPAGGRRGSSRSRCGEYVTSSSFGVDVMENWQSEYLQFFLYIFATVWLIQLGSAESKEPGEEGTGDRRGAEGRPVREPRTRRRGRAPAAGGRRCSPARSGMLMGALFLLTWAASSVAGWAAFNSEQLGEREDPVSWLGYLGEADFWNRSFQNWQSEMLAVGSMAVFSVYLRQRGSPESKPVGAAHAETGETG